MAPNKIVEKGGCMLANKNLNLEISLNIVIHT